MTPESPPSSRPLFDGAPPEEAASKIPNLYFSYYSGKRLTYERPNG